MRVPILIVIPLCLLVILGAWWAGSRKKDFMTPPSAARLEQVKQEAIASLPEPDKGENAISPVATGSENSAQSPGKPALDLGDLSKPPRLDEYAGATERGSEYLINVALKLEAEGRFQRALTAWERVIDHSRPNESQRETAVSSITRLRPTLPDWNTDPAKADRIVLHAGTGKRSAELLQQPLEALCKELGSDSSGLVIVTPEIAAGRSELSKSGASPVAIWFSGNNKNAPSTDVLSFTFEKADELPSQLEASVFGLLRTYLARNTTLTPIPDLPADKIDETSLKVQVTRYAWKNFAALLNQPNPSAPKEPPPAKVVEAPKPEPARRTTSKPKPKPQAKPKPAARSTR